MKYEKLSKRKINFVIISLGLIVIIGSVLVLNITKAKYKTTVSVPIVSGTINYSGGYDFKIMALYQQKKEDCSSDGDDCYTEIDEMPEVGYVINTSKSYCTLDGEEKEYDKLYTNDNGEHIFKKLKKNEKCYLYFDKEIKAGDTIIANSSVIETDTHFDKTSCLSGCGVSENGLYKAEDDFGTSYYFRGTVQNNWVKFGKDKSNNDIYWRIIRINGDGTIRLIYAGIGTGDTPPDPTGTQTQINSATYPFNSSSGDNMYVGYQYASGDKRGHTSPSNAYTQLKQWFEDNLNDEWASGSGKIDSNAGFCGDRSSSTSSSASWLKEGFSESGGIGSSGYTYYGAHLRLTQSNRQPTLKCSTKGNEDKDYFTYTSAKETDASDGTKIKGTQSLTYPVGLITADEVAFAGGVYDQNNTGYWLYTNSNYWTMSPSYFNSSNYGAGVFIVISTGYLNNHGVDHTGGLRPVINLKADTQFTFDKPDEVTKGTSTNPYIVS